MIFVLIFDKLFSVMVLIEIKKYPDPVLRKKCQEVKEVIQEIKNLGWNMIEIMGKSNGAGLAAPQVDELKRVIVVQTEREPIVLINPKITKKTKETEVMEEGCLSFPGVWLKIKRPLGIEVEAIDKDGKKVQIKAEGILARILEHEIDHLDGVLFIDHVRVGHRIWELLKFYLRSKK